MRKVDRKKCISSPQTNADQDVEEDDDALSSVTGDKKEKSSRSSAGSSASRTRPDSKASGSEADRSSTSKVKVVVDSSSVAEAEFMEGLPTPPPEINMKVESKHVDFSTLLPSLAELEGEMEKKTRFKNFL